MDCRPFPKIQSLKTLPRGKSSGVKKGPERNEHARGGSQFAFGLSRRKIGGDWMLQGPIPTCAGDSGLIATADRRDSIHRTTGRLTQRGQFTCQHPLRRPARTSGY